MKTIGLALLKTGLYALALYAGVRAALVFPG
jgi:hypothetical protein